MKAIFTGTEQDLKLETEIIIDYDDIKKSDESVSCRIEE